MNRLKIFLSVLIMLVALGNPIEAKDVRAIDGLYTQNVTFNVRDTDGAELLDHRYAILCFSDQLGKNYPQLMRALENFNYETTRTAHLSRSKMTDQAREFRSNMKDYFHGFFSRSDLMIRRADSTVLSLIEDSSDYLGGAHGMYGWHGVNFDSQTGKRLAISDVCNDAERLFETILYRLKTQYDERVFHEPEKKILELIHEDTINFVLEPRGVTFIFNPYAIAPYASGMLRTTLLFDEYPELFKPKYTQSARAFGQEIPMFVPTALEINGKRSTLSTGTDYRQDDVMTVTLDERGIATNLKNVQSMFYVHADDGHDYLYIDAFAEADGFSAVEGECITVFKLDGEFEMYDRMPYTFRRLIDREGESNTTERWLLTDPNSIRFDSAQPVSDLHSHFGAVGENGMFTFG